MGLRPITSLSRQLRRHSHQISHRIARQISAQRTRYQMGTRRQLGRFAVTLALAGLIVAPYQGAIAAPTSQAQAAIDDITRQVSEIRGLPRSSTTPVVVLPRADLVTRLSKELNTDKSVREFLTSQMLLEVLGAMERGFDLRQLQLRLLDEQTIAVYDFDERTIFVVADVASGGDLGADARLVVAHESTHALQDQAYGLKRILPADPPNSDAATAARALVEGDAMLTMRIWGRQYLRPPEKRALGDDTTPKDPVMSTAPPLVQGELLFPYDAGWVFAQLLYQDGGFEAVNKAFARPPVSTEQILHPEKYAAGEQPVTVTIPPLERWLGGSWVTRRTDVFGELVLRLLLEPSVGWPVAESSAAGWGGDAYTILEDTSGRRVVGLVTVWDTEADASEMYNAWSQSIPLLFNDAVPITTLPGQSRWTSAEYQIQVLTSGNTVRMIYAPDTTTLDIADRVLGDAAAGAGTVSPSGPATVPGSTSPGSTPPSSAPFAPPPPSGNLPAPEPSPNPLPPPGEPGSRTPGIPERPRTEPTDNRFAPPPAVSGSPVPSASPSPDLPPLEPMTPPGSDTPDAPDD